MNTVSTTMPAVQHGERAAVVRIDAVVDRLQREQRDRDLGDGPAERGRHADDDPPRTRDRDLAHQPPAAAPHVRRRVALGGPVSVTGRGYSAPVRRSRAAGRLERSVTRRSRLPTMTDRLDRQDRDRDRRRARNRRGDRGAFAGRGRARSSSPTCSTSVAQDVVAEIGDRARYVHCDVTREDDWAGGRRSHVHGVDVLVNNAAILHLSRDRRHHGRNRTDGCSRSTSSARSSASSP